MSDNTDESLDNLLSQITPAMQRRIDFEMGLAKKIHETRKAKGWTQEYVAKAMGVSDTLISRWESGTHNFRLDTIFRIEEVLGINLINLEK